MLKLGYSCYMAKHNIYGTYIQHYNIYSSIRDAYSLLVLIGYVPMVNRLGNTKPSTDYQSGTCPYNRFSPN